ncbi:hypothetical protein Q4567_02965 [Aliiglaciecola sp. 2_MG-2023]|uniref:hypothetical protein n=1 Tax=unclassified Aliiglaciecola TaxID=2593648 RepID=UPI0026E3F622|nr:MULTISPECIES: hypothetical protein [unclassified Aliiglaciecola]MDO6709677.1 hypothetical protein [Aliiglaciecola sp. 2_MG-2023]MDO6750781.1 hypothetical protein [Aliiglaciecola sp. 1_MG-2023]
MTKQELIEQFNAKTISRQSLGVLRRMLIQEVFENFAGQPIEVIETILNKNKIKVDLKKLARKVGYNIKPHNIRQSFMNEVVKFQDSLRAKGHIAEDEKNRTQESNENTKLLIDFIRLRLAEPNYEWPTNLRGTLYRRAFWAYFIDTPLTEVKYPGSVMAKSDVTELLAEVDVKIVNGELKTLNYSNDSALDEMSDTMESKAISRLRKELKECRDELVEAREVRLSLEKEVEQYKQRQKGLLGATSDAIKFGSIH